jgi:hypothetical protein
MDVSVWVPRCGAGPLVAPWQGRRAGVDLRRRLASGGRPGRCGRGHGRRHTVTRVEVGDATTEMWTGMSVDGRSCDVRQL